MLDQLKDVKHFNGTPVVIMDKLREQYPERFTETGAMDNKWFEETIRPKNFIYIREDKNSLAFTLQKGPIKEVGVNGCQVTEIIAAARDILIAMNAKFPCRENACSITKLDEAIQWQDARTKDRMLRGVEGTSQK